MLIIKNSPYPHYGKIVKLIHGLKKHFNDYTSLLLHIHPDQNMLMLEKNDKKEQYQCGNKKQGVEEDQRDLVGEIFDNKNERDRLPRRIPRDMFQSSQSTLSLKKVCFRELEFLTGKLVSNIKQYYPASLNNNLFYSFHDQMHYAPA